MPSVEATSWYKGFVANKRAAAPAHNQWASRADSVVGTMVVQGGSPRLRGMAALRFICGERVQLAHLVQHAAGHKLQQGQPTQPDGAPAPGEACLVDAPGRDAQRMQQCRRSQNTPSSHHSLRSIPAQGLSGFQKRVCRVSYEQAGSCSAGNAPAPARRCTFSCIAVSSAAGQPCAAQLAGA